MYEDRYSKEFVKKLSILKKKDASRYQILRKTIDRIISNPTHTYKFLHHSMKGVQRVHIKHDVLIFVIDHAEKTVSFEDYDHHDRIYR